ncbi:MAG: polymorphic toxin-type HINT domain-containing protein, partial [Planctomycetales bacterium]
MTASSVVAFDDGDENALRHILAVEKDRFVERNAELAPVRNRGLDSAWWQSGFVAGDDQWLSYDEAVAARKQSGIRRLYEEERSAAGDSAEGQLRLASWCGRNGLPDRERVHLLVALETDPQLQNERLLKRAGFERVLGGWMSKERLGRIEAEADRIDESLDHWRTRLLRIERQLRGSKSAQRKVLSQLEEISDPKAVAAIDLVLGRSLHLEITRAAMRTLAQIDGFEASQVLAKYAVFSDNPTVRREATGHLDGRRYEDFVPGMISLMATEVRATLSSTSYRPGEFLLNSEIAMYLKLQRETDDQIQVSYTRFRLIPRIVGVISLGLPGYGLIRVGLPAQFHATKRRVDEVNEVTTELNGRVGQVLSSLIGRGPKGNPHYWWKWWNAERDVEAADKSVVEVSEEGTALEEPFLLRMSCFAAGTPVWTENGLKPIESIRIGDRVLSKNVESGELAFRTVLKTTVRKAKPLVVI